MALISFSPIIDGTSPQASQVNNPLNTIYNEFNGNISAANLASDAITTAKLADGSVTPPKWTNPYRFCAYSAASTTLGTSFTKVTLGNEEYDTNNNFASSTYTAPVNGVYQFTGAFTVLPAGSGERFGIAIYKNGSVFRRADNFHSSAAANVAATITTDMQLAAGDTIELYGISNTGGRGTTNAQAATYLCGHLIATT